MADTGGLARQTYHSSPLRTAGLFAIALAFAVAGVLMIAAGSLSGWLGLAFGVVGVAVFGFLLVRPNRLELTAQGLTTVTLGRRWSAEWSQCGEFHTWKDETQVGGPTMVVFDCSAPGVRGHVLELAAMAMTGANAALPETYGMKAEELAALLNAYRQASAPAPEA